MKRSDSSRVLSMLLPVLAVFFSLTVTVHAASFDKQTLKAIEKLSKTYQETHPGLAVKQGAIILDIEDESEIAVRHKIGEAVRFYLEKNIHQSLVFFPVDRQNLQSIVKEIEISQSGLISENSAVSAGNLSGAAVLISGNVVVTGAEAQVNIRLTETETGKILETVTFTLPQSDLIAVSRELQYEYVSKHGIGLTLNGDLTFFNTPLFNKTSPFFMDLQASYRIQRWLLAGVGLMFSPLSTGENYRWDGTMRYNEYQKFVPDISSNNPYITTRGQVGQLRGLISMTPIHLDLQYTVNFSPKFNIGITGSLLGFLENPTMDLEVAIDRGIYYRTTTTSNGEYVEIVGNDTKPLHYIFASGGGAKIEIKPEYFITPRLAVHGTVGYLFFSKMKIEEVRATYATWHFRDEHLDSSTWIYDPATHNTPGEEGLTGGASYKYYGLNPAIKPDGGRYELDIKGLYFDVGLSFFF